MKRNSVPPFQIPTSFENFELADDTKNLRLVAVLNRHDLSIRRTFMPKQKMVSPGLGERGRYQNIYIIVIKLSLYLLLCNNPICISTKT